MNARVAVDLGGTKILAAAGTAGAVGPLQTVQVPTVVGEGREALFDTLCAAIDQVLTSGGFRAASLGVCVPGIVDPDTGTVMDCSNLPGWEHFPLGERLARHYGVEVRVENDARAACWAEATTGAGAGKKNVVFVTLSTGIGAGMVIDGRLYRGTRGVAGELGEMRDEGGDPVERRGGGRGFAQRFGFPTEELKARFDAGEPLALEAYQHLVSITGRLLANVATLLDPDLIVVGGGLSRLGPWYLDALQDRIRQEAYSLARQVPLVPARWGGEAGVRGMLALGASS